MNNDKLKADLKHIQSLLFLITCHINNDDLYDLKKGFMIGRDVSSILRFIEKMIKEINREEQEQEHESDIMRGVVVGENVTKIVEEKTGKVLYEKEEEDE